ncbi:MAG: flagellin [Paracoccus marcusii]
MSSILTNNSAMVALQTLKNINSQLGKTQSDIATGKTVANAKDNAAVWAISKVMETDQSAAKTIQSNLNVADATVGTARQGAEQVVTLLKEVKDLALGATISTADFGKIDNDIDQKFQQIAKVISGTQMNGVNLLRTAGTGTTTLSVVGSLDRTAAGGTTTANTISVATVDLQADLGLDLAAGTSTLFATGITDTVTAAAAVTAFEGMINNAVNGAADLGSAGKRISDQANFVGKLSDSLKSGIGSLVDADMEESSARLQALQTQQQLGIQALSIANQGPSAIMSLFR